MADCGDVSLEFDRDSVGVTFACSPLITVPVGVITLPVEVTMVPMGDKLPPPFPPLRLKSPHNIDHWRSVTPPTRPRTIRQKDARLAGAAVVSATWHAPVCRGNDVAVCSVDVGLMGAVCPHTRAARRGALPAPPRLLLLVVSLTRHAHFCLRASRIPPRQETHLKSVTGTVIAHHIPLPLVRSVELSLRPLAGIIALLPLPPPLPIVRSSDARGPDKSGQHLGAETVRMGATVFFSFPTFCSY